jgi:hypothetical protein
MTRSSLRRFRAGLAAGLLLGLGVVTAPAADEKLPPPTRAELQRAQNNLKQIMLAFHNYADVMRGPLPNNINSKDGKGLLSWRVQILPYIEEDQLYKQFKLDEPWDSENNKNLIAKMPKLYAPVRVKAKEGETFYQVFTGEKAAFGPKKNPRLVASFKDGLSNTGVVFEAGTPVVWTKPDDMAYDEKKPLPKLGGLFDGECNVGLGDGSVTRLKKDADEKELRKLIMPADGEPIDFKKLRN